MTKVEILKRIKEQSDAQSKTVDAINKLLQSPSVGADATVIASILATINATIFDTMTTLALILSEMLPEPTPEETPEKTPEKHPRGHHCSVCEQNDPGCKCLTCSRDNFDVNDGKPDCCRTHPHKGCCVDECPDYVKEDPDA